MKRYKKYEVCELGWIKEIPSEWKIISLKYISEIFNGSTPKDEDKYWDGSIKWLTPSDLGSINGNKFIYESRRTITEEGLNSCGCNLAPSNSIILSTRAPIGHVAIPQFKFATNQGCKSIVPLINVSSEFLYYFIVTLRKELEKLGSGSTFMELSTQSLADFKVLVPSSTEQLQIASYLDYKTSHIDELIAKKQRKIELLKEQRTAIINRAVTKGLNPDVPMKDSGVEWIGEIPDHWITSQLKHIGEVKGRIGFKGYAVDDLVDDDTPGRAIVLGGTNVMKSGIISYEKLTYLSEFKYLESPEIMLKGGEILITKVGAGVGENAIYTYHSERVTINPNVMLFVPNSKAKSEYINFYLMSDFVKQNMMIESHKSGAQPAINQSFIKSMLISLPPIEEQEVIINYLLAFNSKIDSLTQQVSEQIERLKEYRQSLISEVVTGKIDVRDWQPITNNN